MDFVEINKRDEFKKIVSEHKYVILKASAEWCGPCKKIKPYFLDLCEKTKYYIKVVLLDIDKGADLKRYLKIKSVPTIISFIDGEPKDYVIGINEKEIENLFVNIITEV